MILDLLIVLYILGFVIALGICIGYDLCPYQTIEEYFLDLRKRTGQKHLFISIVLSFMSWFLIGLILGDYYRDTLTYRNKE